MANMLGLFMMLIVQDQNVLLTYAITCTLVRARNFNLLLFFFYCPWYSIPKGEEIIIIIFIIIRLITRFLIFC